VPYISAAIPPILPFSFTCIQKEFVYLCVMATCEFRKYIISLHIYLLLVCNVYVSGARHWCMYLIHWVRCAHYVPIEVFRCYAFTFALTLKLPQ